VQAIIGEIYSAPALQIPLVSHVAIDRNRYVDLLESSIATFRASTELNKLSETFNASIPSRACDLPVSYSEQVVVISEAY